MTILSFPAVRLPSSATLRLMGNTQSHASPFDGSVQTISYPGAKWRATMTWQPMPVADWRKLQAFITSLAGQAGRFTYSHPMTWRRSTLTISTGPRVQSGGQTGTTLACDQLPASVTSLYAGDFISFADPAGRQRMHQITADVTADSSGVASIQIAPAIRISPSIHAAIEFTNPVATWMLSADDTGDFSQTGQSGARASVTLDITEAVTGSP